MSQETKNNQQYDELQAMKVARDAIQILPDGAISRVLYWLNSIFEPSFNTSIPSIIKVTDLPSLAEVSKGLASEQATVRSYRDLPDFISAGNPKNDWEKALLALYYIQVIEENSDGVKGAQINNRLKFMGHIISNITVAMNTLMSRRPQLVIQTAKTSNTMQGKKTYRITTEGEKVVETMLKRSMDTFE